MNAKHSSKTYCIVCKKETENKNPKVFKTKKQKNNIKVNLFSVYNEKSKFLSKNEGSGLLSKLGIRTPLSQIAFLNILF